MNEEQINSLIEQLRASGMDDEKIMDVFFKTFQEGKMDREDLETLANVLGYELTDEFKNDPTPDPIESEELEDMSTEELQNPENVEEDKGDEDKEDDSDSEEDEDKEEDSDSEEDKEEDDSDSEEDEEEWKKAQKLFQI